MRAPGLQPPAAAGQLIRVKRAIGRTRARGSAYDALYAERRFTQAIQLREALRRLLLANNGGELSTADLDVLNRVARDAQVRPRFLAGGQARPEPEVAGPMGALGRIVSTVSDAMTDGSWFRLKACAEGSCRWAFYDRSKNRSGHWCSMAVCGSRSKARQFRQRQRKARSKAPT